jgi:hypothetical protein
LLSFPVLAPHDKKYCPDSLSRNLGILDWDKL